MLRHRGFCGKPRRDHGLGQLRDMRNRLVDHEEFSAQRCFYHDVTVPINEKPATCRGWDSHTSPSMPASAPTASNHSGFHGLRRTRTTVSSFSR